MTDNRKRLRRFEHPGHVRELTFSCYGGRPLLLNQLWCEWLAKALSDACLRAEFSLSAFVFMPNHVHLLVFPQCKTPLVSELLAFAKRPFSAKVKADLEQHDRTLLNELTVQERPGKFVFRFWQEGAGYDRNLASEKALLSAIDYIHLNPVRRGLCERASQWRWSSAAWYSSPDGERDLKLPGLTPVPAGFFME